MCDNRIVELSDKLYRKEITVEEYSKQLEEYGFNLDNGTGLSIESFMPTQKNQKKHVLESSSAQEG
jgi:hypothetical protein